MYRGVCMCLEVYRGVCIEVCVCLEVYRGVCI